MRRDNLYGLFEDVEVGAEELDGERTFLFVIFDELFYICELLVFGNDGVNAGEFGDN